MFFFSIFVLCSWQKLFDGPSDSINFIREVARKASAIKVWLSQAASQSLLSASLNLSELFHPATFLNAFRQYTSRKCKINTTTPTTTAATTTTTQQQQQHNNNNNSTTTTKTTTQQPLQQPKKLNQSFI